MSVADLYQSAEFSALRATAARLGNDPLQIQGPGGNVSIKSDGKMLVKASGTWLSDAQREDVFTPVDASAMAVALRAGDPSADQPVAFLLSDGLRPSIETSFHAILEAPVVLHTHCVATLARSTAPISQAELDALELVFVPYQKPGAELARSILEAWHPGAKGAVLGNHGLIVVADTVEEAEAKVYEVARHFDTGPVPVCEPDPCLIAELAGSAWTAMGRGATTALAFHPECLAKAAGPALFPDQLIFLGPEPFVADLPMIPPQGPPLGLALFRDRGAAVPENASPACIALAEMMGEVVFRLRDEPTRLTESQTLDLLGWDAEKYRQSLENQRKERLAGEAQ